MGRVVMNGPPECPDGEWCVACLMRAKQRQWEGYQDRIQAGFDAPGDKTVYVQWPEALTRELRTGLYRAVCGDFPQLGIVPGLCWDDVAGINPTRIPAGLEVANGPLPPGLLRKGRG